MPSAVCVKGACGGFEFGREARRHGFDDLADRGFKLTGEAMHVGTALFGGTLLGLDLFALHALDLDCALLEDIKRARHVADFVAAILMRHFDGQIVLREPLHDLLRRRALSGRDRAGDADEQRDCDHR